MASPTKLNTFWRAEMEVIPSANLIHHLMPWLPAFEQQVKDGGDAVPVSESGLLKLLPYLATVVIQDALELCYPPSDEALRADPVHRLLLQSAEFV